MPSTLEQEKEQRLARAAKLLDLIAADTKRRAQQESASSSRLQEVADTIREALNERDN